MALNKIDGSGGLPGAYREPAQTAQRRVRPSGPSLANHVEPVKPGPKPEIKPEVKPADVAEISTGARAMADLQAELAAAPERREELLAQVRERLATGFYRSPRVFEKVAEKIAPVLRDLGGS